MALLVTSAGTSLVIRIDSISYDEKIDDPATATFTVPDSVSYALTQNQVVQVTDTSTSTLLYSGFVDNIADTALPGNTSTRMRVVTCKGNRWLAEKRYWTGAEFNGWTAGDVAAELHRVLLASEGVTAAYALRHDMDATSFGAGTLAGTTATSGTLTLASAGTDVTKVEATTADFNSYSAMSGIDTTGNQLALASHAGLKLQGTCTPDLLGTDYFVYQTIAYTNRTIVANDILIYSMWVSPDSPSCQAGIDLVCTDGTLLRKFTSGGNPIIDQFGFKADPAFDLKNYASGQWYTRQLDLTTMAGKTLSSVQVAIEGDKGGIYTAYFYDIYIQKGGGGTLVLYSGGIGGTHGTLTPPSANKRYATSRYINVTLTPTLVYESTGSRTANTTALGTVGNARNSLISWQQTLPPNTAVSVATSLDGNVSFQPATNFGAIPELLSGASLAGMTLSTRITLTSTSPEPDTSPSLADITWVVQSGYAATKADVRATYLTTANFNQAGTSQTDMLVASNKLSPSGFFKDWADGSYASQTMFGGGTNPQQGVYDGRLDLTIDNAAKGTSRMDAAGTWQYFMASIDIQLLVASDNCGIEYHTTTWTTLLHDFAYVIDISATQIFLRVGQNGTGGAETVLQTVTFTTPITVGDWHTLTIVISQSGSTVRHQGYLDGAIYIDHNDNTYIPGGMIGLRYKNSSGSRADAIFANFGVAAIAAIAPNTPMPVWTSNTIALGTMTVDRSIIFWTEGRDPSSTIIVSTSINGGAYVQATSGQPIPNAGHGASLGSGATLKIQVQMQTDRPTFIPTLSGLTAWISSQFTSTGTRISPVLALDAAQVIGSSSVTWTASTPTGTSVAVATSPDNSTYTSQSASGNPVAGLVAQGSMIADDFTANTAANYTATFWTGGVAPVFSIDLANTRMQVTSGTNGIITWNTFVPGTATDVYLELVTNQVDTGGMVWRYTDVNNCYYLILKDSGSGTNPNTLSVRKRVASVDTQILAPTTLPVTFTRGTYHTLKVSMAGTTITVLFDGIAVVAPLTDASITAAGKVGIYQSSATTSNWYSIAAQQLGGSAVGKSVYSKITLTSTDPTVAPQVTNLVTSVRSPDLMTGALINGTDYAYKKKGSDIMADVAGQSKMYWRIDKNRKQIMKDRAYSTAPWPLYSTDPLLLGVSNPPVVTRQSPMYRNRQFVTGAIDLQTIPESKIGDGTTQSWVLKYPVDSVTSLTLGGNPQTVGVQGVDTGKNFYYQPGQPTLSQDSSGTPPTSQQLIALVYVARVPYTSMRESVPQQTALAAVDGTTGIVEASEDCGGLPKAAADVIAQSRIDQYAILSVDFAYSTQRAGLAPGNLQSVFMPEHGLSDTDMLLTEIKTTLWQDAAGTLQAFYDVSATSGPNLGSWMRLFT